MPIKVFDHYTVRAGDFASSVHFYEKIMGMRAEINSELGFRIGLMYLGEQAIVHILETGSALDDFLGRNGSAFIAGAERGTGNMEHLAFNGTDIDEFRTTVAANELEFTHRTLSDFGVEQILLCDPDGIEIEVNFSL
jgi:catechol 2,3-dioxygenase-like lactoylglutathione lyase family enzyme